MAQMLEELTGTNGEALALHLVENHKDPLAPFLLDRLRGDPEQWPFNGQHQGWSDLIEGTGEFKIDAKWKFFVPKLFVLCRKETNEPVACSALIGRDMTRKFDPVLPKWLESLLPWRSCVTSAPGFEGLGYEIIVGRVALQHAKRRGYEVVFLFVSLPPDGPLPSTWRGYPCEVVWTGNYCVHIPMADGSTRPPQMVLAIPLENVPTPSWKI